MKKFFFFFFTTIILTSLTVKKTIKKTPFGSNAIATWNGSSYTLNFSTTAFETWFNEGAVQIFEQAYTFNEISIDDPDPTNLDSIAYIEIKANATNQSDSIVLLIYMIKTINNDTLTLNFPDYEGENLLAVSAGIKCTTIPNCNGCKKKRDQNGERECPCTNNPSIYCTLERSSSNNLPAWLSAIVAFLIYLRSIMD